MQRDEHRDLAALLDLLGRPAAAMAKALRTSSSSRPSSARRSPSALAWMPMRCSADTALGDVYPTQPARVEHDHAVTDPRRLLARAVLGRERELPAAIIRANRWKIVE